MDVTLYYQPSNISGIKNDNVSSMRKENKKYTNGHSKQF